jgi:hypothetical protein
MLVTSTPLVNVMPWMTRPKQAHRVLAVVARQRREFVQHPAAIRPGTQGVPPRQCHY